MLALALTLPSCTMTDSDATKSALCDQFKPILWSQSDTPETVRQAKEHNAVAVAVCGAKPNR